MLFLFCLCTAYAQPRADDTGVVLSPSDRILILAPHPDDEVIGCAGIVQEAVAKKIPVKIAFLTNGDNNEWAFLLYRKHPVIVPGAVRAMGAVRKAEAIAAAAVLGVSRNDLLFLGYPDFGTLAMWRAHWGSADVYRSMLTRVRAVPYQDSYRPGAPYKAEEILADIVSIIQVYKPTKIFLSHPGDHNPDHTALFLFTQIALWDLSEDLSVEQFPYLVHYKHWPRPRGWHPDEPLSPPGLFRDSVIWQQYALEPDRVMLKRAALQNHSSEYASSPAYLLSFVRRNELFGTFPVPRLISDQAGVCLFDVSPGNDTAPVNTDPGFSGIIRETVTRVGDTLVFQLDFKRPVGAQADIYIYCFGYRQDKPFRDMPKIQVRLGLLRSGLYDQGKKRPLSAIGVTRAPRIVKVVIPLSLLGDPRYIMTSSVSYLSEVPLDWPTWYIFSLAP